MEWEEGVGGFFARPPARSLSLYVCVCVCLAGFEATHLLSCEREGEQEPSRDRAIGLPGLPGKIWSASRENRGTVC